MVQRCVQSRCMSMRTSAVVSGESELSCGQSYGVAGIQWAFMAEDQRMT